MRPKEPSKSITVEVSENEASIDDEPLGLKFRPKLFVKRNLVASKEDEASDEHSSKGQKKSVEREPMFADVVPHEAKDSEEEGIRD